MATKNNQGGAQIGELLAQNSPKVNPYKIPTTSVVVKFKVSKLQAEFLMKKGVREERPTLAQIEEKKAAHAHDSLLNGGKTRFDSTGHKQFDAGSHFSKKAVSAERIVEKFSTFHKYELQDAHIFQKSGEEIFTLNLTFEKKEKNQKINPALFSQIFSQGYREVHVWHNPDGLVTFNFVAPMSMKANPVILFETAGTMFLR
jgi:hypothetical protein